MIFLHLKSLNRLLIWIVPVNVNLSLISTFKYSMYHRDTCRRVYIALMGKCTRTNRKQTDRKTYCVKQVIFFIDLRTVFKYWIHKHSLEGTCTIQLLSITIITSFSKHKDVFSTLTIIHNCKLFTALSVWYRIYL